MSSLDNPAARLEAVLKRALPLTSHDIRAIDGWKKAFDVESDEDLVIMVAAFVAQVQEAREAILDLPESEDPGHLLAYFDRLDGICANIFSLKAQAMQQFGPLVTPELIYSLGSGARALRRNGLKEPVLDDAAVHDILDVIKDVLDEIAASDLPHDVRLFIVRRLRDVEGALPAFQMAGYSGVEAARRNSMADAKRGQGTRRQLDTKGPRKV